jgi:hypothetical protein
MNVKFELAALRGYFSAVAVFETTSRMVVFYITLLSLAVLWRVCDHTMAATGARLRLRAHARARGEGSKRAACTRQMQPLSAWHQ